MQKMIIGICGFIGSGKGTVGDILRDDYGFVTESFAKPLKDATAPIFGWDRSLLEGDTAVSREFREQKDIWWSEKLGYDVTPRLILQKMGTEAVRNGIDDGIWLHSLEKRLTDYCQYVITDVRFENEVDFIRNIGGKIVCVYKNPMPEWYDDYMESAPKLDYVNLVMETKWPNVHRSEWDWLSAWPDYMISNDGTIEELSHKVSEMLEYFYIENAIEQGLVNV
jgi:hypothetical protein